MKKILFSAFIAFSGSMISCSAPVDEDATAVCACYKLLHRVDPNTETELMNFLADSCKTLHADVLKKIEGDEAKKIAFIKAYDFCQND